MFFTVILPTYNRASLLPKAINSIVNQTFKDWELIVVDDGSTDFTNLVIKEYSSSGNIKYHYQDNMERSVARNTGISLSEGEWICFLDSDDYFLPTRLQDLHDYIISSKAGDLFYFTDICYESSDSFYISCYRQPARERILDYLATYTIGTPQVCIHKSLLRIEKFNPYLTTGEDFELWLRLSMLSVPTYIPHQPTIVATEHAERSVNSYKIDLGSKVLATLSICFNESHVGYLITKKIKNKKISSAYFKKFKFHLYRCERLKAFVWLSKAIILDFTSEQLRFRLNILLKLTHLPIEKIREAV